MFIYKFFWDVLYWVELKSRIPVSLKIKDPSLRKLDQICPGRLEEWWKGRYYTTTRVVLVFYLIIDREFRYPFPFSSTNTTPLVDVLLGDNCLRTVSLSFIDQWSYDFCGSTLIRFEKAQRKNSYDRLLSGRSLKRWCRDAKRCWRYVLIP